MGLFGLATLASVKRRKEISIRKVYGAGVNDLVQLLTTDYLKPVLIGFVAAVPVAWLAVNRWLEQFAFRVEPDWWVFAAAGLLSIILALVTVCFHVMKTALTNPAESLRSSE